MTARGAREHEGEQLPDFGSIELGTVGWDDGDKHYELDPDSGVTLVKVTLFRGHEPVPTRDKRARGRQLKCRIGAPLHYIPADGTQVAIVIPAGFGEVPGAGIIVTAVVPAPPIQFGTNDGKDAVLDFGEDRRVIIKAGRGVILSDYDDRYCGVGPEIGFKVGDADANGAQLKNGKWSFYVTDGAATPEARAVIQLDKDRLALSQKNAAGKKVNIKTSAGTLTIMCDAQFLALYATALLGKPTGALPAALGPTPGTVSANTFIGLGL